MSNIEPYQARPASRTSRQVRRDLDIVGGRTGLGVARIEAQAELQALKVDAVTHVGRRAMQDVAMLSQLEQQLATLVPLATSRLQAVEDMTALGVADIVGDTVRRLNQC